MDQTAIADERKRIVAGLREVIAIDPRSAAAFRIGLGSLLTVDAVHRYLGAAEYYTEDGFLPRALAVQFISPESFSLHLASGSELFRALMALVISALAVAFAVGWHTRLVTPLLWVGVTSLQNRNPFALNGADHIMRLALFWAIFVPVGRRWSLDRLERGGAPTEPLVGLGTAGLLFQVLQMYVVTAARKTGPTWSITFEATQIALQEGYWVGRLGAALVPYTGLLKVLTGFVYYLEVLGPPLLILPFVQRYVRSVVPWLFIGFHAGLVATMALATFPWACMAVWLLFLPGWVWERLPVGGLLARLEPARARLLALPGGAGDPDAEAPGGLLRKARTAFLIACIALGLLINVRNIRGERAPDGFPGQVMHFLRLNQTWSMYAPDPYASTSWWVFEGVLRDGSSVNAQTGERRVQLEVGDPDYWRDQAAPKKKFVEYVWMGQKRRRLLGDRELVREQELRLYCQRWNRAGVSDDARMVTIKVHEIVERYTANPDQRRSTRSIIKEYQCPDGRGTSGDEG